MTYGPGHSSGSGAKRLRPRCPSSGAPSTIPCPRDPSCQGQIKSLPAGPGMELAGTGSAGRTARWAHGSFSLCNAVIHGEEFPMSPDTKTRSSQNIVSAGHLPDRTSEEATSPKADPRPARPTLDGGKGVADALEPLLNVVFVSE